MVRPSPTLSTISGITSGPITADIYLGIQLNTTGPIGGVTYSIEIAGRVPRGVTPEQFMLFPPATACGLPECRAVVAKPVSFFILVDAASIIVGVWPNWIRREPSKLQIRGSNPRTPALLPFLIGSRIDILLRLKAEESHGTAPLDWEFQVCRLPS